VVKLTLALADPILRRCRNSLPPPELVDSEEEYIVEKVLNSRMFRRRLQYLVKWEGYGTEHNTWEYSENVNNAPEKVAEFHAQNMAAPRRICTMTFGTIPFRPISLTSASSRCSSRGGGDCKGNPFPFRSASDPSLSLQPLISTPDLSLSIPIFIPTFFFMFTHFLCTG